MLLLGNYQSNLTAYLYQQLLTQLETSISAGEFGAGTLFDTSAAQTIQQEGQNFSTITVPAAGNTAYANDVNNPLATLQARYNAITSEVANVQDTVGGLLDVISKESDLIDKTIAAAAVEVWAASQPLLPTAQTTVWNFETGHGVTSTLYPEVGGSTYQTDPTNGVAYLPPVPDASYVVTDTLLQGIGSPTIQRVIPVKSLVWAFTPNSPQTQFETIYGDDQSWASLSTLEPSPILTFGPPNIAVVLPIGGSASGLFTASGSVAGGSLPVYVRILFYPRQQTLQITNAISGSNITLSPYNVTANTVQVFSPTVVYNQGIDFSVNAQSILTIIPTGSLPGQTVTAIFEEYYPAYQCSIDQTNWSPIFMLDPNRPYPDDTTDFIPIDVQGGNFPLSDELGVPLGLFLQMVGTPTQELELLITTPGSQSFGENAQLNIDLERAVYMNGLQLSPFSNFPVLVQSITAFGFTSNIQTIVVDQPFLLDRTVTFKFTRQLVKSFSINFYQQNYSIKEYLVEGSDALRRDTLATLQASLPFSVQRPAPSTPQPFEGALYSFGIQDITAFDDQPNTPGVFVSGPYTVTGMPEIIRLDAALANMSTNAVYLGVIAYNGNDEILDQQEYAYTPGTTTPFVPSSMYTADHVDFWIKFVFRNELSVAEMFKLQVTTI